MLDHEPITLLVSVVVLVVRVCPASSLSGSISWRTPRSCDLRPVRCCRVTTQQPGLQSGVWELRAPRLLETNLYRAVQAANGVCMAKEREGNGQKRPAPRGWRGRTLTTKKRESGRRRPSPKQVGLDLQLPVDPLNKVAIRIKPHSGRDSSMRGRETFCGLWVQLS